MMNFIMMTLSITVALLLAMVLAFVILSHPKVIKWYTNWVMKRMMDITETFEEDLKIES